MNTQDLLIYLISRPADLAERLRGELTADVANASPAGHDNSIAWLLWHTGREIDL